MTLASLIPPGSTFVYQDQIYRMTDYGIPDGGSHPVVNLETGDTRWFNGDEQVEWVDYRLIRNDELNWIVKQSDETIAIRKKNGQLESILELTQANAQTWYEKYNTLRDAVDNLKSL